MTFSIDWATITEFVQKLEGPYKWYVIGGVIILLTAIFSRLVFKTLKWLLLLAFLVILIIAAFYYFNYL